MLADTPEPPYYAVIFTSLMGDDSSGYAAMADRMLTLARAQPGFLGVESAREGIGITVSYWSDLDAIRAWKRDIDHREAQRLGRERWYAAYRTRIARVERDYSFEDQGD
ncbi:antibiotic biosynthesis monooxygenase [Salinicola sp. DM10]|uniref:antibiotic biosynthesis monooxygenase family protein n=1 Tax=Salinicola sp. DM10 TaxID=2815721 RepID=UPI001A8F7445|nr:antibiotic biosynthesis monooxygenase [Salinicola sp. DM10]MCE3028720.1 antibiotic biosynthesis monooxygenase [Salinicola sp. DM10]